MQSRSAAELAAAVGARLVGPPEVVVGPAVVIDSRKVTPGCLFVALRGERVDGHDFVAGAIHDGAVAVLVARELPVAAPQLIVSDPAAAMANLASWVVAEAVADGLVSVGVTGSSGKTSTKDLVAAVLARRGPTVSPVGSANNEIGAPLTALTINSETAYLVSELGARGPGHVRWLCDVVHPLIGVVTNVGHAHVGEFGSVAAIAEAKSELVQVLPASGWAVLNGDDSRVAAMSERTPASCAVFSRDGKPGFGDLRVWAEAITVDHRQRATFTLHTVGAVSGTASVSLQVNGIHQVSNALAAAAVGMSQGMTPTQVAEALSEAKAASRWRMEVIEAPDDVVVINDSYNANPDSMAAALRALAGMRQDSGRLIAVLGDMLELGDDADAAHRAVGELAGDLGVTHLLAIGEFAEQMTQSAARLGVHVGVYSSVSELTHAAEILVEPRDVVLVKASRGLALESVAERLADPQTTERDR